MERHGTFTRRQSHKMMQRNRNLSEVAQVMESRIEELLAKCSSPRSVDIECLPRRPIPPSGVGRSQKRPSVISPKHLKSRNSRATDNCIAFDGKTSTIEMPDEEALERSMSNLVVDFWIRTTSTDHKMMIFDSQMEVARCAIEVNDGVISLILEEDADKGSCGLIASSNPTSVCNGMWHLIKARWNPSLELYFNGVKQIVTLAPTQPVVRSKNTRGKEFAVFGCSLPLPWLKGANLNNGFVGNLAEIRVWGGSRLMARYACDEGVGDSISNKVDKNAPSIGRNTTWGNGFDPPPTVLEFVGNEYLSGGTLSLSSENFYNIRVSLWMCSRSTKDIATLLGVTDSLKKHSHYKIQVNTDGNQPSPGSIFISIKDACGSTESATYNGDLCDGRWHFIDCTYTKESGFSVAINDVEVTLEEVQSSQRLNHPVFVNSNPVTENYKLTDFLAIGAHNDRGKIKDCYKGLISDVRILSSDQFISHWPLTEGPGVTIFTDTSGNSNHAILRIIDQSGKTQLSAHAALVDKHTTSWVPIPSPQFSTHSKYNRVVLPVEKQIPEMVSPFGDFMEGSLVKRPVEGVRGRKKSRARTGHNMSVSCSLETDLTTVISRMIDDNGRYGAVNKLLTQLLKVDNNNNNNNKEQTVSDISSWVDANQISLSEIDIDIKTLIHIPITSESTVANTRNVLQQLSEWSSPIEQFWSQNQIKKMISDMLCILKLRFASSETRDSEASKYLIYPFTYTILHPVVWGVYNDNRAVWNVVSQYNSLEIEHLNKTTGEEIVIRSGFHEAIQETGITETNIETFRSERGTRYCRYEAQSSNSESCFIDENNPFSSDAVLWLTTDPSSEIAVNSIPPGILEYIWGTACTEKHDFANWSCFPLADSHPPLREIIEVCKSRSNPRKYDPHLVVRLHSLIESEDNKNICDTLQQLIPECDLLPWEMEHALSLQKLSFGDSNFTLSLSGERPHILDNAAHEVHPMWRITNPHKYQIQDIVSQTLREYTSGVTISTASVFHMSETVVYSTTDCNSFYNSVKGTDSYLCPLQDSETGNEIIYKGENWYVSSHGAFVKVEAAFELGGWVFPQLAAYIATLSGVLASHFDVPKENSINRFGFCTSDSSLLHLPGKVRPGATFRLQEFLVPSLVCWDNTMSANDPCASGTPSRSRNEHSSTTNTNTIFTFHPSEYKDISEVSRCARIKRVAVDISSVWACTALSSEPGAHFEAKQLSPLETLELRIREILMHLGVQSSSFLIDPSPVQDDEEGEDKNSMELQIQLFGLLKRLCSAKSARHESDYTSDLSWGLEEITNINQPLLQTQFGWECSNRLLSLGASRSILDSALRRHWTSANSVEASVYLKRIICLVLCGASPVVNGVVLQFPEPFSTEYTPLHVVTTSDSMRHFVVPLLTVWGIPIDATDSEGRTALHIAAISRSLCIMDTLLSRSADTDIQDSSGMTPVHYAAINPAFEHTEDGILLISKFAMTSNLAIRDRTNATALDLAQHKGHIAIVHFLSGS